MKGKQYKDWDLLDELPEGWKVDKTMRSPIFGYQFCTNGRAVWLGQKRALVKANFAKKEALLTIPVDMLFPRKEIEKADSSKFPARRVHELARLKFQEQLLKEIQFDMMVCKIEGWDQMEYIEQLQNLLNSFCNQNQTQ